MMLLFQNESKNKLLLKILISARIINFDDISVNLDNLLTYLSRCILFDEIEDQSKTIKEFEEKIGRYFAQRLYEPEETKLINDTIDYLVSYLVIFASEFYFSDIDKFTKIYIKEQIESYIKPTGLFHFF